ncbi:sigma-70 family RNA polymerase sigma factor [Niallia sp. FSL W8-0635]|uniref:sigma-70 family RNA polymerase sigma factor n=1 Tax=Niallia sp. FSL W8-0635 TaxID=2975337 RepID=UPI0009CB9A86|nr:RNA polymerase sigma factor SigE [Mycobacteroides abscessus subsp. abscessus]HEO8419258.1 sigma-70 family RNA polymerase sigma factor [Yersinia enterocolitica]
MISKRLEQSLLSELEENQLDELLEEIMILYGDELTRLAYTYVKDSETAKDIVQTVFIKCYTHLKTFKGEAKLKTWLYRITINKCKDYVKSAYSRRFILFKKDINVKSDTMPSPEEEIIYQSMQAELKNIILSLPLKYAEVILLYYYEELDINEIADILQISKNTAKTRLRRGRKNLLPFLKKEEFR